MKVARDDVTLHAVAVVGYSQSAASCQYVNSTDTSI